MPLFPGSNLHKTIHVTWQENQFPRDVAVHLKENGPIECRAESMAATGIRKAAGAKAVRRFKYYKILSFAAIIILVICRGKAQTCLVGVRGGTSFQNNAGNFQEVDAFGGMYLPWLWGSQDGLHLKPRVEGSAGWLDNRGDGGFIGTVGPVLELRKGRFPLTLEGGVSLCVLSRSDFPDKNLGGWFEFVDHVGLNWHITDKIILGWRYQHMSNAGFYRRNPGLNLQMLSVSFAF